LTTVAGKRLAMSDGETPRDDSGASSAGSADVTNDDHSPPDSSETSEAESPSAESDAADGVGEQQVGDDDTTDSLGPDASLLTRFRESESLPVVFLRETISSALVVLLIGAVLFAVSGIWPPMVAVESGSMEPHMQKGDLVFVTEPGRFAPDAARDGTGIVTYQRGEEVGYATFGAAGSVIVYRQPGRLGPPIIHRARFYVEEGENWYDRANPAYLPGDSCAEIANCPAPNDGFVTKGDNNAMYDQVNAIDSPPVKPAWIRGVARVRIPLLGWIRLFFSGSATTTPVDPAAAGSPPTGFDTANSPPTGLDTANSSAVDATVGDAHAVAAV
jgi:signal peptidase